MKDCIRAREWEIFVCFERKNSDYKSQMVIMWNEMGLVQKIADLLADMSPSGFELIALDWRNG
jgi:hypothetical protein